MIHGPIRELESQAKLVLILVIQLTCLFGSSLDNAGGRLSRYDVDWEKKGTAKEEEERRTIKWERTIATTRKQ